MAYCCVPLCKSDEKKKPAGLSFHELPADADARARWLVAIRPGKWWPNTTSCYTKVCSRHFKEEDFIEGKRRRLKNGTVPSVFEEYPTHLQPKSTPARNTASIDKRFLAHDIGPKREVSSCYIKNLYDLQKDLVVKPVRYLSRKHVCPNNIEKTNVARAIQVFSPDVTAALEHLRDQAGRTSRVSFAAAGQTIVFMQNIHRWFVLHDTSNTTQHIHKKWPDTRQFDDAEYARLEWHEVTLPVYLDELEKKLSKSKGIFDERNVWSIPPDHIFHSCLYQVPTQKGEVLVCAHS
ncbi:hypothetical protein HPB51_019339 [Rhipicephalus microplus]|uniref:THAP-type domain-containing protein n=1 Tax=Rhipicephalus microplus TaxID=6941 RepID=A0A9J6D6R3_RHIMP|nr:hypothetical protein HPB51_019339 [Rhipicephalus microplus]